MPVSHVTSHAKTRQLGRKRQAPILSFVLLIVAVVGSDAAMVAVCGVARVLVHAAVLQWLSASAVIAGAGFCLFGAPQIVAWSRSTPPEASDARARWSPWLLGRGGPVRVLGRVADRTPVAAVGLA